MSVLSYSDGEKGNLFDSIPLKMFREFNTLNLSHSIFNAKINVDFSNVQMVDVFEELTKQSQLSMVSIGAVSSTIVTVKAKNKSLRKVFLELGDKYGFLYELKCKNERPVRFSIHKTKKAKCDPIPLSALQTINTENLSYPIFDAKVNINKPNIKMGQLLAQWSKKCKLPIKFTEAVSASIVRYRQKNESLGDVLYKLGEMYGFLYESREKDGKLTELCVYKLKAAGYLIYGMEEYNKRMNEPDK